MLHIGLSEQAFGSQLVATLNAETSMCSSQIYCQILIYSPPRKCASDFPAQAPEDSVRRPGKPLAGRCAQKDGATGPRSGLPSGPPKSTFSRAGYRVQLSVFGDCIGKTYHSVLPSSTVLRIVDGCGRLRGRDGPADALTASQPARQTDRRTDG